MKLRFTGENPPLEYLEQYPNWSNAYDEEGEDDQDETTLKPHEQQEFIDYEVSFTADIITANGTKYVALLEVIAGIPGIIDVYANDSFVIRNRNYPIEKWENIPQNWLPENERVKEVSFNDTNIFPLRVKSRLPLEKGEHIHFKIEIGGYSTKLD